MKNDRNKNKFDWGMGYDSSNIEYSPEIIQVFAKKLYDKADAVTAYYSILWGFIGGIFISFMIDEKIPIIFFSVLFVIIGYVIGQEKSFKYKLDAQIALCQVQIEMNTRTSTNEKKEDNNSSFGNSCVENFQKDQDDVF